MNKTVSQIEDFYSVKEDKTKSRNQLKSTQK